MERTYKQRSIEVVKTTMLKQEEIFKQQVKELHRLYSVQRMLMEEMKRQRKYSKSVTGYRFIAQNERENAWERSGSCSGGDSESRMNAKRSSGFDFEIIRSVDHPDDNSTGMSNVAGPSRIMGANREGLEEEMCGLDLTLSIGGGSGSVKKRLNELEDNNNNQCIGLECSDARKLDQKSHELQLNPCLNTMTSSKGTQNLSI